jgi:colicin import membrane protein
MKMDNRGVIGTIIFHGVLLLIFLYAGFTTHLPLPAEKGILINFGDVAEARGGQEPVFNTEIKTKAQPKAVKERAEKIITKESRLTQDFEDAPSIKEKDKPKKKETIKIKEEPKPETITKKTEAKVEAPREVKPTVNTNALYQGRKRNTNYTGSEGIGTGVGNQGSLSGSENATDRSLNGGSGGGTSFSLEGRNSLELPKPDKNLQKEGRVVVEIQVDRAGNVIGAIPGVKGSTTLDNQLLSAAKKAALSSKFDSKADAAFTQIGTITYIFKLK